MKNLLCRLGILWILISTGCGSVESNQTSVGEEFWGTVDGKPVMLLTMKNKNGMVVRIASYGATVTYIAAPDRNGNVDPVVLGFDSLENYLEPHPNFGSTIGRFANRIAGAEFSLDDIKYNLTPDRRGNSIHGGAKGFSKQVFDVDTAFAVKDSAVVSLKYLSPDSEEGFPGNLVLKLDYVLTNDNELKLIYTAITDKPTVVNFTNHSYFNLSGCKGPVSDHILMIAADSVTPVDSTGIPTGELLRVSGTPYDFTEKAVIREKISNLPRGYDLNYVLRKSGSELALAAEVYDPVSGRLLQAYTTEPGMQLFLGNSDLSRFTGHNGVIYGRQYGICLEMQHFPDSPNKPHFPNVVLRPGETYRQLTVYKFSTLTE